MTEIGRHHAPTPEANGVAGVPGGRRRLPDVRFVVVGLPEPSIPDMVGYGVDASTWTPLDWSWAGDRLRMARNYWLTTVSRQGRPHSMPVWGVWEDGEQRFSFSCAPSARKARNLAANPLVVVTTESTVECLSIEGRATLLDPDDPRREPWIERLVAKYRAMGSDLGAPFLRRNLMFEVEPQRAFAVIERDEEFSTRATRWTF